MSRLFLLLALLFTYGIAALGAGVARGKVVLPDGKPAAGAVVYVRLGDDWPTPEPLVRKLQTAVDGSFEVEAAAGTADVEFQPVGYAVVGLPGYALCSRRLVAGEVTFLSLTPAASASGVVRDEQGRPIAGVRVQLSTISSDDATGLMSLIPETWKELATRYSATTDATGHWVVGDLPDRGRATFVIAEAAWQGVSSNAELTAPSAAMPAMTARPGASLAGRAVDVNGVPMAGVKVAVQTPTRREGLTFGNAVTAADGTFAVQGLAPGDYVATAATPSGDFKSIAPTTLKAVQGTPPPGVDIKLAATQKVGGVILDDATGKPMAGVRRYTSGPLGMILSTPSDIDGRYTLYVSPGDIYVVTQPPYGYRSSSNGQRVTVAPGTTMLPAVRLRRSPVLSGVAVDMQGKAVAGAAIGLVSSFYTRNLTDENGRWRLEGFDREMTVSFRSDAEWEVIDSPQVKVAPTGKSPEPITLKLRRSELTSLRGRVVTPAGKPLEGITVDATVALTASKNVRGWRNYQLATDADGFYILSRVPRDRAVQVEARQPGFRFRNGGAVKTTPDGLVAEDLVLATLNQTVKGRVLDAESKPVAGAWVTALQSAPGVGVVTGADGGFELSRQPEGEVAVVAARGYDTGLTQTTVAPAATLEVRLKGGKAPAGADFDGIEKLLAGLDKMQPDQREMLGFAVAAVVARDDPDRALGMVTGEDGSISDHVVVALMSVFIRRHPEQAADWALPQIDRIRGNATRQSAMVSLGIAVAPTNPELGKALFARAKAAMKPMDYTREAANTYCSLAALALQLKLPEANELLDAALATAKRSVAEHDMTWVLAGFANILAQVGATLPARFSDQMELEVRLNTLSRTLPIVARVDFKAAQKQLELMKELAAQIPEANPPNDQASVVREKSGDLLARAYTMMTLAALTYDPAQANLYKYKSSRTSRAVNLARVAAKTKAPEERAAAFAEAWAEARGKAYNLVAAAQVATLAYRSDAQQGLAYWKEIDTDIVNMCGDAGDGLNLASLAGVAYYRAQVDPAWARLLLETEYARLKPSAARPRRDTDMYSGAFQIMEVARAMAAIDTGRASAMAAEVSTESSRGFVLERMVKYMAATTEERAAMPFEGSDNEAFNNG